MSMSGCQADNEGFRSDHLTATEARLRYQQYLAFADPMHARLNRLLQANAAWVLHEWLFEEALRENQAP